MAKRNSNNKGLILGTVLGSLAGAAYALWKTPMSGQELRSKLSTGPVNTSSDTSGGQESSGGGITDKVMNAVEHTLAPIVGVDLGKTANQSASTAATKPINVADTPADVAPPTQVQTATSAAGTPIADPEEGEAMMATGSDTIRMKKFAWGTPAPEAEKAETPVQGEMNAPVEQATSVDEPDAKSETASATATSQRGQDTIRSQRFAWGDPKPESAETAIDAPIASSDMTPEQRSQPVADSEPAATSSEDAKSAGSGNVADTIVSSAASVSTGKMAPFPKLGGLENNS